MYNYYNTHIILNGSKQRDSERLEKEENFFYTEICLETKVFCSLWFGFIIHVEKEDEPKMFIFGVSVPILTDTEGPLPSVVLDEILEKICHTFDVPTPSASALPTAFTARVQLYPG